MAVKINKMCDFVVSSIERYKYCNLKVVEVLKILYFQCFICFCIIDDRGFKV